MKITSSTPLYALLGHPVQQSLSPILQNGWIKEHGFDGVYVAFDIEPDTFASALKGLYQIGLRGGNVTTPFKEQAAQQAMSLSRRAQLTKSVNCLSYAPDGFDGDSTDGAGFIADLDVRVPGWRDISGPVVMIGAGGAARAMLFELIDTGATEVVLINRDPVRAHDAVTMMPDHSVIVRPWSELAQSTIGASLVINATSAGFKGLNPLVLDFSQTNRDCVVYDSVYAPRQTTFLKGAQDQNRRALDGLGMLVGQGALAFENWFGVRPDFATGMSALNAELSL